VKYLLLAPELFESEGGITRILRLYLKALCENAGSRDDVQFISLNDSMVDTSVAKRFSTDRLVAWKACRRSKLQFILSAFKRGLSSDKIVCGHIGQLPVAWAISLIRPRMSYYLVAHGIEVWRPFSMLEKAALRRAKCILCVSDYTRGQVLEHCPMPKETTAVLYNALDPTLQTSPARPPDPDSYVILTVSRLSLSDSYKGIEHLIAAMPEVRKSIPGARLRVVGRGDGLNKLQGKARRTLPCAGFSHCRAKERDLAWFTSRRWHTDAHASERVPGASLRLSHLTQDCSWNMATSPRLQPPFSRPFRDSGKCPRSLSG